MLHQDYFYKCSAQYVNFISPVLYAEITGAIDSLPKRRTQSEINNDMFWLLGCKGWSYDNMSNVTSSVPPDLTITSTNRSTIQASNQRDLCLTTTSLGNAWRTDFAKDFSGNLVQLEVQFGKVESMFKDFCGFRIASYERRLALGIEVVISNPAKYFAHRKASISGMAYFDAAKNTLPAIGLECPIWLIGIQV